jgi:predicted DNA-binding transcriptional regulator YafY
VAKDSFKNMPNYKLGTLAKELNITLENHHRALDDAIASLRIMAKAIIQFRNQGHPERLKKSYLFKIDDFTQKREFDLPKKLEPFKKHIRHQRPLEIIYKGGSHRGKFRPLKPLAILPLPTGAAMYALCLLENQHKLFKLNKITDIRESSDKRENIK